MQSIEDRLPPQNNEAEQSVLGSILLQPTAWIVAAMEFIQTNDFYRRSHQLIFQTMIDFE